MPKVEKRDGGPERRITIGTIVDKTVLAAVAQRWEPELCQSKYANIVIQMCVDYYRKHKKAPGKQIESLFERWQEKHARDKDTVALIDQFLSSLSGEYARHKEALNPDHLIDIAGERFTRNKLKRLATGIEEDLERGDVAAAEARRTEFKKVDIGAKAGVDFGLDDTVIDKMYERQAETLVEYRGPIGEMLNPAFYRDALVAFMGPENSGKSMWVADVAWRGMKQGKKIAFFEVGDQSDAQLYQRLVPRQAKQPLKSGEYKYPTNVWGEDYYTKVQHDDRFSRGLSRKVAQEEYDKLAEGWSGPRLRLHFSPGDTLNVDAIRGHLDNWERDGFDPSIICIDYADLLAPISVKREKRDEINQTWISLRALAMERHVLVVTATQTNRVSYDAQLIGKEHVSDDKRKLAHATGIFGINRTDEEVGDGTCRINCVKGRSWKFNRKKVVYVAGCYELARPAILSSM